MRLAFDADSERTFGGYGADTDIIVASAKAYLAALNRLLAAHGYDKHKVAWTAQVGESTDPTAASSSLAGID